MAGVFHLLEYLVDMLWQNVAKQPIRFRFHLGIHDLWSLAILLSSQGIVNNCSPVCVRHLAALCQTLGSSLSDTRRHSVGHLDALRQTLDQISRAALLTPRSLVIDYNKAVSSLINRTHLKLRIPLQGGFVSWRSSPRTSE